MTQSFQKFTINADTKGNLVKESRRDPLFFLSVKEVKERWSDDYAVAIEEFKNKQKNKH